MGFFRAGISPSIFGLWLAAISLLVPASIARSEDDACTRENPLLALDWNSFALDLSGKNIGEWRLPLSAERPEVITEARLRLSLIQASAGAPWKIRLDFLFPDPKPFGIPFSFRKAEVRWRVPTGTATYRLDWSNGCSSPGRSLFPGQAWSADLEIPGTETLLELDYPQIRLWGSRN